MSRPFISPPSPSMVSQSSTASYPSHVPSAYPPVDEPALIVPIDQNTVKRLVAGQAVMDLASIVKELIDNALDAGAKSINS
eukprot:13557834-Ditylum_brightwellii.AAC.1